jgi:hypothetical protein
MTSVLDLIRAEFGEPSHELGTAFPRGVHDRFLGENNHAAGIRAPHALEALKRATHVDRYDTDDGSGLIFATSPVTVGVPYTMLILVVNLASKEPWLDAAYRLYDISGEDPTAALAILIERYGVDVQYGEERARFIARGRPRSLNFMVPNPPGAGGEVLATSPLMRVHEDRSVEYTWMYALNISAYAHDVQRLRR